MRPQRVVLHQLFGHLIGQRRSRVDGPAKVSGRAKYNWFTDRYELFAEHLYVFQRTPSSVDVRGNVPTDPAWVASLQPGWQYERMKNFNDCVEGADVEADLVQDGWTKIFRNLTGKVAKQASQKLGRRLTPAERGQLMELADYMQMNSVRDRVDEVVVDDSGEWSAAGGSSLTTGDCIVATHEETSEIRRRYWLTVTLERPASPPVARPKACRSSRASRRLR